MPISIVLLVVLVLFFTPHWWVRTVMRRYRQPRDDFSGTCGEFARHLLDRVGLKEVHVDVTQTGDHYGPRDRTVCLSPEKFDGRSLTAVVVAAHEVGHALQDAQSYPPLRWRHRLLGLANAAQPLGNLFIIGIPIPVSGLLFLAVAWPALVPPHSCTLLRSPSNWTRVSGGHYPCWRRVTTYQPRALAQHAKFSRPLPLPTSLHSWVGSSIFGVGSDGDLSLCHSCSFPSGTHDPSL